MRGLLLTLLVASSACLAVALYEDQVGTFDWYKQYVGEVATADFLPSKDRLYVSTRQNLIASLSSTNGSIAWRRTFNDKDPLGRLLVLEKPSCVISVSRGGKFVRAWDPQDGAFKWEAVVAPHFPAVDARFDVAAVRLGSSSSQCLAIAAGDRLQVCCIPCNVSVWGQHAWSSAVPRLVPCLLPIKKVHLWLATRKCICSKWLH